MAAKHSHIVTEYLEDIGWKVFQQYPGFLADSIRGRSGVYVLYRGESLYYVGLATNLKGRLQHHLKDRHKRKWDRFSVYLTARSDAKHIRELEALLLRIVTTKGNRQTGRLRQATDLWKALAEHAEQKDEHQRAATLGGKAKKQLRRRTTNSGKGAKALVQVVSRATRLQGTHKGNVFHAVLRPDGHLRMDGALYQSPTAAARVCVGRTVSGWHFWKVRDKGEWVPLDKLRK